MSIFSQLSAKPGDALLALIGAYRADPRVDKIDLGVGVYRDEAGRTPVMSAVKQAERIILETQSSKSYLGVEGDPVYVERLQSLLKIDSTKHVQVEGIQTPGGSAALRLASDLIALTPNKRIWLGLPSWPNHAAIFGAAGLELKTYPFFDIEKQTLCFDRMMEALDSAKAGDAVLLHASCHNPTGAVLSSDQWSAIVAVMADRGLLPLIDCAYQGFGKGLDADCAILKIILEAVPEALMAVSSSKSFSLYRERTGALFAAGRDRTGVRTALSNLVSSARTSYSMPPDHGAAVVRTILDDPELRLDWEQELASMRNRLHELRQALSLALSARWPVLKEIAYQEGMFSLLPVSEKTVTDLRENHGIYMPASGRINLFGLTRDTVDAFAHKIAGL